MARGIHRFVIRLGSDVVSVRAQSVSLRGQAYTVGGVKVRLTGTGKAIKKAAVAEAISTFYPD